MRISDWSSDVCSSDLKDKPALKTVTVLTSAVALAKKLHLPLAKLADGVEITRNVVTEPANVIYPATLAAECRKLAKLGVKVQVLEIGRASGRERVCQYV